MNYALQAVIWSALGVLAGLPLGEAFRPVVVRLRRRDR